MAIDWFSFHSSMHMQLHEAASQITYLIRIWLSHHQAGLEPSRPSMVGSAPQPELNQQTWLGPEAELTKAEATASWAMARLAEPQQH